MNQNFQNIPNISNAELNWMDIAATVVETQCIASLHQCAQYTKKLKLKLYLYTNLYRHSTLRLYTKIILL